MPANPTSPEAGPSKEETRVQYVVRTRDRVVCWRGLSQDDARAVVRNREANAVIRYNCAPHSISERTITERDITEVSDAR